MIVHAVSCPHPPLLLPGLTGGPVPEVDKLRAACGVVVERLVAAEPDVIVAVGSGTRTRRWSRQAPSPSFGSYGEPTGDVLSLSLAVAVELLKSVSIPVELHGIGETEDCRAYGRRLAARPERLGLLAMADGSARRGPKAPGYEDHRALAMDRELDDALRTADFGRLFTLQPEVARDLLIGGRASWQVLAGACESLAVRAECHYSDDPFGVWYPVFEWTA